ncbi:MAG: Na+/H+ antiporter NhaC family protein [Pseudohongiella sp.]|nr:Na+/H+ antiporter NhaC family protein [Pseudohongiella sp.]MDP2127541.1 Na+/H+ antiporter NhaC family protein [Pseudohongiella sp.]
MSDASPDITSLIPILTALVVAISLRNVIVGLFIGLFVGVLQINGLSFLAGISILVKDHLVPQVMDSYNAGVLVLLGFIGGFVALMEGSGGGAAFATKVTRYITNRVKLQISVWMGGVVIFFSDLGTPLIVGPAFRPLADSMKLSRAKLAYIIDSTASPIAVLVPFIGWGVYIMSLLEQQFQSLQIQTSDFAALVSAMPYQFYAWLAVLAVPVLALTRVDFGPMQRSEQKAQIQADVGPVTESSDSVLPVIVNARASYVWMPLMVLGFVLLWTLVPLGFPFGRVSGSDFRAGLSTAYIAAALCLVALMAYYGSRRIMESVRQYLEGVGRMTQVAIMLLLAWALGDLLGVLGTDIYVASVAAQNINPVFLPVMIFMVSCLISFATGSSWGTYAIMIPLSLPAAVAIGAPIEVCIGAILSGGLFGDHCSPISETTILAATGANCDQFEHFQTQLPYALGNGLICIAGFLIAGTFATPWILALLFIAQISLLVLMKKRQSRQVSA